MKTRTSACSSSAPPGGQEAALGKRAKKLYLEDHPGFQFPKKTIFAQGQMVEANRWTGSMMAYLERALEAL